MGLEQPCGLAFHEAGRRKVLERQRALLYYENTFLLTHVREHCGPDGGTDFADMCLLEQQHERPGLTDAAAYAQRNVVVDDRLMIRQFQEIEMAREFQLPPERLGGDADVVLDHRNQYGAIRSPRS